MFPDPNQKPADTGNASNPTPQNNEAPAPDQLLDKHAEKYLREVANIEDVPDAQDADDMDKMIESDEA